MTILDAALLYAKKGFSVIPMSQKKLPLVKWEPYQKVRADEQQIKDWFKRYPSANVGIVTGEISNLFVVDCDTPEGIKQVQDALSDTLLVPCETTPRGGRHFYFSHSPGFPNKARVMDGVDIRTEGGVIVCAPSVNGNGRGWKWVISILDADPPALDNNIQHLLSSSLSSFLTNYGRARIIHAEKCNNLSQVSQNVTNWFEDGVRDEHLIHAAICLQKGGAEPDFARYILNILVNSWGENDPKWVDAKIKSAWDRAAKKERNLSQEARVWVEMMSVVSQGCNINVTDFNKCNNVAQNGDIRAVRMAFKRLCDEENPMIEKTGKRAGEYRIINRENNEQKWWEDDGEPLPLVFPLGVEMFTRVFPGNVMLLEGQKSQGKSAFAIEFCRLNQKCFEGKKAIYQNVEMSNSELLERFRSYDGSTSIEQWKETATFIRQSGDWWDKIDPDGLNVVDYLIEYEKAYLIAEFVWKIHKALKKGVALVVVQRDPYKPYPTGGRGVRDIPRLILSLVNHKLRIEDSKSFNVKYGNPAGLAREYKLVNWCDFRPVSEWRYVEDEKYDAFKK